jgi:hypothetical protein
MSAPASVSGSVGIPEYLVVERVEIDGYERIKGILIEWKSRCDDLEKRRDLTDVDRQTIASAKLINEMIGLSIPVHTALDALYICKDARCDRILAIATISESQFCLESGDIDGYFLEINHLVANTDNLPLSIFPFRIKGAGSVIIDELMRLSKDSDCMGLMAFSLDSAEGFYRKRGFEKVALKEEDDGMMRVRDDICFEKSA